LPCRMLSSVVLLIVKSRKRTFQGSTQNRHRRVGPSCCTAARADNDRELISGRPALIVR
jgi:hypothetical protein